MACVGRWKVWCCAFFVILRVIRTEVIQTNNSDRRARVAPAPEFSRHALVRPRIYSGREKREVSCTRDSDGVGGHVHDLTIGYDVNGKDYILDLRLNRELIPKSYFERYQNNGLHVVNKPTGKEVELCEYQGKLRGVDNSWAAISTCQGLSGVIFDGEELHYLEPGSDAPNEDEGGGYGVDNTHFLYRHSDIQANQTCGYSGTSHHILGNQEFNRILRYKRDAEMIRGPYNANKQSRYVELVLVVDNKEYKQLGENLSAVYLHCKKIANIINSLYVPLNIFIALVGVVVWTENDEISLSNNGDTTLTNFLLYRRQKLVKEHPNDNAQLLTRVQFDGGVVGKALKGPICTYEFSGGVSMDHSSVVGLVATTVAHEMGHNFGMEHDTADCKCPNDRCIMAPSSSSMSPTQWSSCSLEYLALAFVHGMDYCLRNKPTSLFDSPVCGNGFVEVGEQCDCGLKESCDNPCCNATSCMLYSNASCATGECCDLQTCRPKIAGSECRSSDHECDLPEYCTGQSEYCPEDVFKMDGEECDFGKAFCYNGSCRTHSDQCRLLWGSTGASSDVQCYQMNNKGTRHGNCGYNRLNQSFLKCTDENVYCGMLHCKHLNERLEFGMESVAILSHSFINSGGSIIPCRTAIVDLGLNEVDPGLAPDGAKCGDNKMCVKQKCMPVGSLRLGGAVCPQDCNGNGVCNSRGHCHCRKGFAPPLCDYPGVGGSQDSGPASDPNARRDVMTALYVIFLGIVPFVALVALFMYYTRRNLKHWWKKGSRSAPSNTTATDTRGPPLYVISRFFAATWQRIGQLCSCSSFFGSGGSLWDRFCMCFTPQTFSSSPPPMNPIPTSSVTTQNKLKATRPAPALPHTRIEITKTGLVSTTNTDVKCVNVPVSMSHNSDIDVTNCNQNTVSEVPVYENTSNYKKKHFFTGQNCKSTTTNVLKDSTSAFAQRNTPNNDSVVHSTVADIEFHPSGSNSHDSQQTDNNAPGTKHSLSRKIRRNSKGLLLKTNLDPMKKQLLNVSDSSNPSTPDTPPIIRYSETPPAHLTSKPTVAELASKFHNKTLQEKGGHATNSQKKPSPPVSVSKLVPETRYTTQRRPVPPPATKKPGSYLVQT